jgi:hypothetical protein
LTTDSELDAKFDSIRATKRQKRVRAAKRFVVAISPFILAFLGIYGSTFNKNFPSWLVLISAFILVFGFPLLIFAGGRLLAKILFPLDPVENAFLNLYAALGYKDPPKGKKYEPAVQDEIGRLMRGVAFQLNQPREVVKVLLKDADTLLLDTIDNVRYRLLPASEEGKLTPQTMRQLAKTLAKPSIDGLRRLNTDVEKEYEELEEEGFPFRIRVTEFLRSQPGHIVQSLVFGFGIAFFTVFIFSVLLQESFTTVFAQYAGIILGGIFALTGGYIGYLAVQLRSTKHDVEDTREEDNVNE